MNVGVVIVDREEIVREGLSALLSVEPGLKVLASASSVSEAAARLGNGVPRIIIADLRVRSTDGTDTLLTVKARWPNARVLLLTASKDDRNLDEALSTGVEGYLLKSDSRDQLREAIRSTLAGDGYISPALRGQILKRLVNGTPKTAEEIGSNLTDREREVMRHIAAGRRTREIAAVLSLSHKTVEKHRTSLMRKLGLRSAPAVAAYAIARGFFEIPE